MENLDTRFSMRFHSLLNLVTRIALASHLHASTVLLTDSFNSVSTDVSTFNDTLASDQSGSLAPITYTVAGQSQGWQLQHGNGGKMLMAGWHSGLNADLYAGLNRNFAADANLQDLPLKIQFDLNVTGASAPQNWATIAIGSAQNSFVNNPANKFSSLFRLNGGTQQFASGNLVSNGLTWTPAGSTITVILSDTTGVRSAFNGNGSLARIYVNGTPGGHFTLPQMNASDGWIGFEANAAFALYDNLSVSLTDDTEPAIRFSQFPKPLQLYPRNPATGLGNVLMQGEVTGADCTGVSVTVLRNGAPHSILSQPLTYSNGVAPFTIQAPIAAELANYSFQFHVTRNGTNHLVAVANDVVAGDFYLINGQSNAEATIYDGSANGNQSSYLRSFGSRDDSGANVAADRNWYQANGDLLAGSGAVGQWGLRLGRRILDTYGIPVAIINGARGGWPITSFQRNDANHEDLGTNYGRALYRAAQAGGRDHIRAVFWYQGESDNGDADAHDKGWSALRDDWREDYPAIEKIYVFQLHVGCLVNQFDTDLRNRQRLFADRFPDVEIMSTTGAGNTSGNCHYPYTNGYETLADQLYHLVQRDLYGAAPQNDIEPPNPHYAYFSTPGHDQITLVMRNASDTLMFYPGAEADFRLVGSGATVTSATASGSQLILNLSGDAGGATALLYGGHAGAAEPMVSNATGVGLLAFHNLPIHPDLGLPGVPSNLVCLPVSGNRVDVSWSPAARAAEYLVRRDGVVIGKTTETIFTDTTVAPGPAYSYEIAAASPVSTSAWSSPASVSTVPDNVFAFVPEAADFTVLYRLDVPNDLRLGSSLKAPYQVDHSDSLTQPFNRVAYYLELQTSPGQPLKWVYVSCDPFTMDPKLLGVPAKATGAVFHQPVGSVNVHASSGSGVTTGTGLSAGNIEFWGDNYQVTNGYGVPGASDAVYDSGDLIVNNGTYGSMQIFREGQTLFAYNAWGAYTADSGLQSSDDLGIGNPPAGNPDWTFAANSFRHSHKRLYVLVRTDYSAWASSLGLIGGAADDDDDDGISNSAEYAFGTNPKSGSSSQAIVRTVDFATGELTYTRRKQTLTGLNYTVFYSTNLTDWFADTGASQNATDLPETDNESVNVTLSSALLSNTRLFVRIEAQ
jgi:hypothetical protein